MREDALPVVALLAGGMATRMRPATLHRAKSMLLVDGEPFIGHQLRLLTAQGVRRIVVCCGHFEEQVRAYVGDGSAWGCAVTYSPDGAAPLGTGGALLNALPLLGPAFLVMYGDSYLKVSLKAVWAAFVAQGRAGMMTVYRNEGRWDTSNVQFEAGRIIAYAKQQQTPEMLHIDYGLNCFRADAFARWTAGERFDLAAVTAALLEREQLAGFEVSERFYEIGSPEGLLEMGRVLRAQRTQPERSA
ncbi:nucleotidyltransferase family protein [Acidipila sp. EB88]|uniref:nucleotidyltransferase family protein n=1 Tax=Acidipila sp. EB88 TaxID=2305226 RepID=UPI000F5D6B1D|nr:nucleotidyltransferase family protein [Acidipila sp. EB88]RRA49530.1 nucleotidyl transferase [Acidipila sp. EB88]